MKPEKTRQVDSPDEFDLLSAAWILANNDEDSLITYRGISYRLSEPNEQKIRAMIARRGDLFRKGVSQRILDEWKDEMGTGKRLPSWIQNIDTDDKRKEAIAELKVSDVFRSQFRATRNASRAPIEIISWGLTHIDRLRKASIESSEKRIKQWQIWLVFGVSTANIILTLVLALTRS